MSATDQARSELVGALNLLMRRRSATSDSAEKEQINESIELINEQLQELGHASLLQAASIVAAAGAELEKVVATARTGAFEAFVSQAGRQVERLREIGGALAGGSAAARPVGSARPTRAASVRPKAKSKAKAKPKAKPKAKTKAKAKAKPKPTATSKTRPKAKAAKRRRSTRR